MRSFFRYLLFLLTLLLSSGPTSAQSDSTTLNKEKWRSISKDLNYYEKAEKPKEMKPRSLPAMNSTLIKFIAFGMVALFILFILYKLNVHKLIASYFGKKVKHEDQEEALTPEVLAPSQELFEAAMREKDQKLSLKLLYLACLHFLAEKEILRIRKETTNAAYIRSLSGKKIQPDFRKLVLVHELTWFGEREISMSEYEQAVERAKRIISLEPKS